MNLLSSPPFSLPSWLALAVLSVVLLLAILRLTRLVAVDDLGDWALRRPLSRWASVKEQTHREAWRRQLELFAAENPEMTREAAQYVLSKSEELRNEDEWMTWQARLVSGLYCPFCVGFWIGLLVIEVSSLVFLVGPQWLQVGWLTLMLALAVNYVAGHISSRLDWDKLASEGDES